MAMNIGGGFAGARRPACLTGQNGVVRLDRYGPIRVSGARVAFVDSELVDQFPSSQSALHLLDMRTLNERHMEVVEDVCACWSDLELVPAGGLARRVVTASEPSAATGPAAAQTMSTWPHPA